MRGDAPTGMKDFDDGSGKAHFDFTAHERVRHAVEVTFDFDVVVD